MRSFSVCPARGNPCSSLICSVRYSPSFIMPSSSRKEIHTAHSSRNSEGRVSFSKPMANKPLTTSIAPGFPSPTRRLKWRRLWLRGWLEQFKTRINSISALLLSRPILAVSIHGFLRTGSNSDPNEWTTSHGWLWPFHAFRKSSKPVTRQRLLLKPLPTPRKMKRNLILPVSWKGIPARKSPAFTRPR